MVFYTMFEAYSLKLDTYMEYIYTNFSTFIITF